jgi:hypothetical protein
MKDYYFGEAPHGPNYTVLEHELLNAIAEALPLLRSDAADHPAVIRAYKLLHRQVRRMNARDQLYSPLQAALNAVDLMRWVNGTNGREV